MRALREKLIGSFISKRPFNIEKRYKEIQQWLKDLDDEAVEQWTAIGDNFFNWMKGVEGLNPKDIRGNFPNYWNEFMKSM